MHRALAALAIVCVLAPIAGSAEAGTQLSRLRGDVGYALDAKPGTAVTALVGSILLDHEAVAVTQAKALARVQFVDSSEIQIGDRSRVRIGDLQAASNQRTIVLEHGALRFDVRHPAGPRSNVVFKTPTSQIAVRGTIGYIVNGPGGDEIYCVSCAADDVEVQAGNQRFTIQSGQSALVSVRNGLVFDSSILRNQNVNNPAIDQFNGGFSPLGLKGTEGEDPTGSHSGE
jgi:ferric-dicitrate binding protein FerR (iron transport regulator)